MSTDAHEPLVEVESLEAGYSPGRAVISDLNFSITGGRMVAVLGPNGGGKTTLFRALLGEAPHRAGRVYVNGTLAYVPQTERSRLDFPVSALDVVRMGTYAGTAWYRRGGAGAARAAADALAQVGLAGEAATRFGRLSGGQRQRVLIARALAQKARTLLLDEPLSGVDGPSGRRIMDLLRELRDSGHAIVVSTHDIQQARGFDEVLCVNGTQVFHGPPEGLTPDLLAATYGSELITLAGGQSAIVVQHHQH